MKNYTMPVIMKTNVQLETINASSTGNPIPPTYCTGHYIINWQGNGGCQSCSYQRGSADTCLLGFENKNGSSNKHPNKR